MIADAFGVARRAKADRLFDEMVKRRGAHGDLVSRLFLMPVERQA
jgi:hypothetical protein